MTTQQIFSDILEKKSQKLMNRKEEKALIFETLQTLKMMTELFQEEVHDLMIRISEREGLEWDSDLGRFIYHRDDTSQFLELARKDVLFRVGPYLKDLLLKAQETLK